MGEGGGDYPKVGVVFEMGESLHPPRTMAYVSKWFMVKIYQNFNFFIQFQIFDTVSCHF